MEPVPETVQALAEFVEQDDTDLGVALKQMATTARVIAPDCVALSLGLIHENLTFTLVATDLEAAQVDSAQYLDDGPCLNASRTAETTHAVIGDLLDEGRWSLFARASAALGIASSLSLPIIENGKVVGGINLYGATPETFEGRHEQLAEALGASAHGAVSDADLTFSSRQRAAEAPRQLRSQADIDTALGLLAALNDETVEVARARLESAAQRAALPTSVVAKVVILLRFPQE